MQLSELLTERYDIGCENESQVKQVCAKLERKGYTNSYPNGKGMTVVLGKKYNYIVLDIKSEKTISAKEFLKLNL